MLIRVECLDSHDLPISQMRAPLYAVRYDTVSMDWRSVWVEAENDERRPSGYRPHILVEVPFVAMAVAVLHDPSQYVILLEERTWIVNSHNFKVTTISGQEAKDYHEEVR